MLFAVATEGADEMGMGESSSLPADERLELEQQKKRVRAAIAQLPEKERKLLEGYYFQAKTLEEAGAEIGQSKSWASRLHARAVERLKEILSEDEEPSPAAQGRQAHGNSNRGRPNVGSVNRAAEAPGPGLPAAAEAGRK
jgi:RNA polymerase sigma factor for flagellar operon FliA